MPEPPIHRHTRPRGETPEASRALLRGLQARLKFPDDLPVPASVLRGPRSPPASRCPETLPRSKSLSDCFCLCVDKWLFRVFCLISKLKCLSLLTVDRMGIERMFLKGNNDSKIEDFYIENSHEDGEECHVIIWRQLHKNREKMARVTCKKSVHL